MTTTDRSVSMAISETSIPTALREYFRGRIEHLEDRIAGLIDERDEAYAAKSALQRQMHDLQSLLRRERQLLDDSRKHADSLTTELQRINNGDRLR